MPLLPKHFVPALLLSFAASHGPVLAQPQPPTHPSFDVRVAGRGPAMVLIPGLLSSGEVWDSTVERYKDRYTLHVLTLAGFGGPPPVGAPLLPRVRDEVIAYLQSERLAEPVLLGHSLGGFLAFSIAATAPELVGGVVAVDGVPFLPALTDPAATAETAAPQGERMRALYASFDTEQLVAQSRMALTTMITAPGDVERALEWVRRSDAATAGIAVAELMSTDLRKAVAAIRAPALLVGASGAAPEGMQEIFRKAYESQVAALPGARVVMATKARHFVMLDDPAFLFARLDEFLATLSGPRS